MNIFDWNHNSSVRKPTYTQTSYRKASDGQVKSKWAPIISSSAFGYQLLNMGLLLCFFFPFHNPSDLKRVTSQFGYFCRCFSLSITQLVQWYFASLPASFKMCCWHCIQLNNLKKKTFFCFNTWHVVFVEFLLSNAAFIINFE